MKIAILTSSFPLRADDAAAAAGLFVHDFAQSVARLGHSVFVVTQDKGRGHENPSNDFEVCCFPWRGGAAPLSSLRLNRPSDMRAAISYLQQGNRSVVELHKRVHLNHTLAMWAVPAGIFSRRLSVAAGVPYSVWCLGSDIWTYGKKPLLRRVVASVLRHARFCFADGIQLAEDAQQLGNRPVEFLPSSRKLTHLQSAPIEAKGTEPRFLFVGRYDRVKGVDILIRAMSDFVQREKRGHLTIVGGGPMRAQMVQLVEQLQLTQHVSIGGYADAKTVVDQAAGADAFIIPSRMESIPVVLSDAMQLGKPAIVSDVGDMGSLLRKTPAGIVVPPEDSIGLSLAMSEFTAATPDRFRSAVNILANRFDVDTSARRFSQALTENGMARSPTVATEGADR